MPSNIVKVAVTSRILFIKKKLSLEKKSKVVLSFILDEFLKYNINAAPVIKARNNKMKAPRAGSFANECTEVKIPDLTKKVPNKLREKAIIDNKIVGVNSGHKTTSNHYRSRGIWVDESYRRKGISQALFNATKDQAQKEGCTMLWSIPRKIALPAYTKFGFETVGDFLKTETSESNIYVKLFF